MLTTAPVVETSVIVSNSPSEYYIQLYTHLDWHSYMFCITIYYRHSILSVREVQMKPDVSHFFLNDHSKRRSTLMIPLYVGDEGFLNILSLMSPQMNLINFAWK